MTGELRYLLFDGRDPQVFNIPKQVGNALTRLHGAK